VLTIKFYVYNNIAYNLLYAINGPNHQGRPKAEQIVHTILLRHAPTDAHNKT